MNSTGSSNLLVRVVSAHNLCASGNGAYCTMLVWTNPPQNTRGQAPKCTSLRYPHGQEPIQWNEEVQMNVANQKTEVLTVRIKDRGDSLIGSCNIYLAHLSQGKTLDQWFQLHPIGNIHLKLVINANKPTRTHVPPPVSTPSQPTTMMDILQTVQQEQQKVFARQLKQSQNQQEQQKVLAQQLRQSQNQQEQQKVLAQQLRQSQKQQEQQKVSARQLRQSQNQQEQQKVSARQLRQSQNQQEQQKVLARQLRQNQKQQFAPNPLTVDYFKQMERDKQKTYDQINEQLRLYRQQQNLPQQHPGFAPGAHNAAMFGQQQDGQSIHAMAGTAANIASIASSLQQLGGDGDGGGAVGLLMGALGVFLGS